MLEAVLIYLGFGGNQLSGSESAALLVPLQILGLVFAVICFLKGKKFAGIVGLFIPARGADRRGAPGQARLTLGAPLPGRQAGALAPRFATPAEPAGAEVTGQPLRSGPWTCRRVPEPHRACLPLPAQHAQRRRAEDEAGRPTPGRARSSGQPVRAARARGRTAGRRRPAPCSSAISRSTRAATSSGLSPPGQPSRHSRPAGPLLADLRRGQAVVVAVVPLEQLVALLGRDRPARQPARLRGPRQRAREHARERAMRQRSAQRPRPPAAPSRSAGCRSAGVLTGPAPLRLTVADENQLGPELRHGL